MTLIGKLAKLGLAASFQYYSFQYENTISKLFKVTIFNTLTNSIVLNKNLFQNYLKIHFKTLQSSFLELKKLSSRSFKIPFTKFYFYNFTKFYFPNYVNFFIFNALQVSIRLSYGILISISMIIN